MPGTAIVYCRVSSDRQASEGHGLDGQERRCREYAVSHGLTVSHVFRDEGASGGTIDRPALQEMFAYLRRHRNVDMVLFEDVSRIARDMSAHIQILAEITRLGAAYQTVNQPIEDTAVGTFIHQSLANVAEFHRRLNAQNVRSRMKARLQSGYWTFDSPPGYVYATVGGHGRLLVPVEPDAGIVREALEGFASGRFEGQSDVRQFLQGRGLKTRNRSGVIHPEQVRRILTQVLYTGHLECRKWSVPLTKAHHEPLIPLATFDRIQERLAQKPVVRQDRGDLEHDFPLRGFVRCAGCGKFLTASWSRGRKSRYPYYHCGQTGCTDAGKAIRKQVIEERFEALLRAIQPRPELMDIVRTALVNLWNSRMDDFRGLVEKQQREIDGIERDIKKYCDMVLETDSRPLIKTYEAKIEELSDRKLRMGNRIEADAGDLAAYDFETAVRTVIDFLKEPCRMWDRGDLKVRRLVLRLVFREPLTHDRKRGFRTAPLSLPLEIANLPGGDRERMVDLTGFSWNRLETMIRESYALLKTLQATSA
jgi:DNA invertase Pin-like site-specific DNA recombinase